MIRRLLCRVLGHYWTSHEILQSSSGYIRTTLRCERCGYKQATETGTRPT